MLNILEDLWQSDKDYVELSDIDKKVFLSIVGSAMSKDRKLFYDILLATKNVVKQNNMTDKILFYSDK